MKIIQAQVKPITNINDEDAVNLIQQVARTCYKTNKPTQDYGDGINIVQRLMNSGHTSMLEFYQITMRYVSNIASYKDLRTHRHSTFAVESSRYCVYAKDKFGNEIKFLDPVEIPKGTLQYEVWLNGCKQAEENYMNMASLGATADQLSLLLPQSTAAEFCVTANVREWRHILSLRSSLATTGHARPCVKEIMDPTLELFGKKMPTLFGDMYQQLLEKRQGR